MARPRPRIIAASKVIASPPGYGNLLSGIGEVIGAGRRQAAWSLNAVMSAVYWEMGRRIVAFEQRGSAKAEYAQRVIDLLSEDLTSRFGRGFGRSNLFQIRAFYLTYRDIFQTASGKLKGDRRKGKVQTLSGQFNARKKQQKVQTVSGQLAPDYLTTLMPAFALPWSHYVRLLSIKNDQARKFYETEALRGGWSFRELDRQIAAQLYERLALSRDKAALLRKAEKRGQDDLLRAEEELREPYILEFLNLKDEYSESDLEETLIRHLEQFLIELGNEFCFVGRQRRLRIGGEWYRVDLLFFHRKLRCLVIIDLKVGKFSHADAGQMHLYCNYAREHWTQPDENPPVGLILCAEKDDALARYSLEGLPNKILAREYKLALPNEQQLAAEIDKARNRLEARSRTLRLGAGRKA